MKENVRYHVKDVSYYWPDEAPVFDEKAIESIPDDIKIDSVITHTAPSFCELNSHIGLESWAEWDEMLLDDVMHERETMDRIFYCLKNHGHPLEKWFYGHFHQSWTAFLHGTIFSMLDIMEFKELR